MNPKKYLEERGIKVPKIVFWNTQNRSNSIPINEARTLITLLNSAINSLYIDSGVKKEIFD